MFHKKWNIFQTIWIFRAPNVCNTEKYDFVFTNTMDTVPHSYNLAQKTDLKRDIDMNTDDFTVIATVMPRYNVCIVSFG